MQAGADGGLRGLGQQIHPADGGNGCQRLAPESHGADGRQILRLAELGGSVAQKRGAGILGSHAAAVVRDPHESHAAVPDLDGHLGGAGIHGVFQQLLDYGGGALHHFTGGDQVGNMGGKLNDFRHSITSKDRFPER